MRIYGSERSGMGGGECTTVTGKDGVEGSVTRSRDNFVRLAETRTTRLLKDLDLLGNLSNRSNYTFTEEDVNKIFRAIQKKVRETEVRFRTSVKQSRNEKFTL
jgi:hypothetical protein